MVFGILLVAMLAVLPRLGRHSTPATPGQLAVQPASYYPARRAGQARADSIVAFGLAQRGTPYVWAGTSPLTGFDCSGFILYTFAHFGVPIPHSTALLIDVGRPVARTEAQPGDIVVFTGTDQASTTPGHAGIVISRRGELPLRFVHASSSRREPFVKVSQVEGSDYERRFMQVRRVLGPGAGLPAGAPRAKAPPAAAAATVRSSAPVAALPAPIIAVEEKAAPVAPLPKLPRSRPTTAREPAAVRKPLAVRKPAAKTLTTRKATPEPTAKTAVKAVGKPHVASARKTTTTGKRTTSH